eukprot:4908535-Pleurochrysis_carterae.AAC.2
MWDYEKGSCGDSSAPLDLFDEQRLQLLAGCTVVASALSIAGSLFIILTYHAVRDPARILASFCRARCPKSSFAVVHAWR